MAANKPKVARLDHVALLVDNIDASARWYMDLLQLEPVYKEEWWDESGHYLGIDGEFVLALLPRGEHQPEQIAASGQRLSYPHFAFRVDRHTWDNFRCCLTEQAVLFEQHDHDGIAYSIYFSDPDNNIVEITTHEVEPRLPKEQFASADG